MTSGKQYNVSEGDTLFMRSWMSRRRQSGFSIGGSSHRGWGEHQVQPPVVEGIWWTLPSSKNGKGTKKDPYLQVHPQKGYRKRQGHRQPYTKVEIRQDHFLRAYDHRFVPCGASRIVGFDVRATAAGAQEVDGDIVCAAVTSAIRLVECTVNDVMGLCASVKIREKDAKISLPPARRPVRPAESTCQNLLTGPWSTYPAPRRMPRKHRSDGGVTSCFPAIILSERMVLNYAVYRSAILRP